MNTWNANQLAGPQNSGPIQRQPQTLRNIGNMDSKDLGRYAEDVSYGWTMGREKAQLVVWGWILGVIFGIPFLLIIVAFFSVASRPVPADYMPRATPLQEQWTPEKAGAIRVPDNWRPGDPIPSR